MIMTMLQTGGTAPVDKSNERLLSAVMEVKMTTIFKTSNQTWALTTAFDVSPMYAAIRSTARTVLSSIYSNSNKQRSFQGLSAVAESIASVHRDGQVHAKALAKRSSGLKNKNQLMLT